MLLARSHPYVQVNTLTGAEVTATFAALATANNVTINQTRFLNNKFVMVAVWALHFVTLMIRLFMTV